jgi:hypothetical protein
MRRHRHTSHLLLLLGLVLLAAVSPAEARWAQGGAPFIDQNSVYVNRAYAAPDGGVVVVTSVAFAYADLQRLQANGDVDWDSLSARQWLLQGAGGYVAVPSGLVPVPGGGYYFAYQAELNSAGTSDPRVLRVDAAKANLWDPAGVAAFQAGGRVASGTEICAGMGSDAIVSALIRDVDPWFAPWALRLQRLQPDGMPAWGTDGILVTTINPVMTSQRPLVVPDGVGGAFVVWAEQDQDTFETDYRVQRISAAGVAMWPAGGVHALGTSVLAPLTLLSDGAGGVYVCGQSYLGVAATHLDGGGNALWGSGGLELLSTPGSGNSAALHVAADATGLRVSWLTANSNAGMVQRFAPATGAPVFAQPVQVTAPGLDAAPRVLAAANGETIVAWRSAGTGLMANRLDAAGSRLWSSTAVVMVPNSNVNNLQIVSDGADGAIVTFDEVLAYSTRALAQRIEADGDLPMLSGAVTAAADVANDEGGSLALSYSAPYADAGEEMPEVTGYNVWRLVPGLPAKAAAVEATDESAALAALQASTIGTVRLSAEQAQRLRFPAGTWESIGFHAAVLDSQYRFVVATRNDTGPAVPNADETFVVTAHSPTPSLFGVSNAITGHSLDNLAPAAPLQLAGSMTGGSVALSWAANTENDLLGYAVYRGVGASFVPSAGTLVAQVSSPQHADPAYAAGEWYKVTAVDRHGNESPVATLAPAQVTGVDGAPRLTVLNLDPNVPNPFNPSTTVWFDLPRPGGVNVGVYDLRGRVVRTLHTGALEAGRHHVEWDGRDTAGDPAAAGVYLLRLETADGEVRNRKMTLAK